MILTDFSTSGILSFLLKARNRLCFSLLNHYYNIISRDCPYEGMHSASKAAVSAIAHTLQLELSPFDVKVITVMAGSVRTGYFSN
jgi:NAD(P)-dependent dehydrogenase (short-subunit alcohol dehydrogenase family)